MFRQSELDNLCCQLAPDTPTALVNDDLWRLRNGFFGPTLLPQQPNGSLVLIGARSGLEAMLALTSRPKLKVIVVERDNVRREKIRATLERLDVLSTERVTMVSSVEEINTEQIPLAGVVRLDATCFSRKATDWILHKWRIDHICGEIAPEEIDPLALFRMCRATVGSFFWRIRGSSHSIGGMGGTPRAEVSVVVPAFKVAQWMDRCLVSLVNQTMERLEIIVVDDGSPDDTGRRADDWSNRYPDRIRVIHKQNGGCASARMAGLTEARGDFVGFVDADDWVDPEMYEELYRAAILHSAEVAQCGFMEVFEQSGQASKQPSAWSGDGSFELSGLSRNPHSFLHLKPSIWRRIYLRKFLLGNEIIFPEHIRRFDDLPFQFEVLSRVKRMALIPDCYYYYRLERDGQDVEVRDSKLFVHFAIFEWLANRVLPWADAEIARYFARCEINTHIWALYRIEPKLRWAYLRKAARQFASTKRFLGAGELLRNGPHLGLRALRFATPQKKQDSSNRSVLKDRSNNADTVCAEGRSIGGKADNTDKAPSSHSAAISNA
jgi:glycosyltransferase involved in cell wall biosynthesis